MVTDLVGKGLTAYRRHGIAGTSSRLAGHISAESGVRLWSEEHDVWYSLPLAGDRPRLALPAGLRLIEGDHSHLPHLATIPSTGYLESRDWLDGGGRLFLVLDAQDCASFVAWVFHGEVPIWIAPGRWLALPAGTAGLAHVFTTARERGRGIAPAAYSQIADDLEAKGDANLIVMTEAANTSARRALVKAGMHPIAEMHTSRRLGLSRMRMEPLNELGRELKALLTDKLQD